MNNRVRTVQIGQGKRGKAARINAQTKRYAKANRKKEQQ